MLFETLKYDRYLKRNLWLSEVLLCSPFLPKCMCFYQRCNPKQSWFPRQDLSKQWFTVAAPFLDALSRHCHSLESHVKPGKSVSSDVLNWGHLELGLRHFPWSTWSSMFSLVSLDLGHEGEMQDCPGEVPQSHQLPLLFFGSLSLWGHWSSWLPDLWGTAFGESKLRTYSSLCVQGSLIVEHGALFSVRDQTQVGYVPCLPRGD